MCWVDSKEFATTFSINYESLRKACLRASKVDKNFCKLKCQNIHFKYTKGIGGCSGKVLQIWSEPFESELDAMKFIANSTLKVENDNTISSSKDSVIVCDDSKRDSVGGKGKGDLESNTQTQYFELSQEQKDKATSRLKLIKEYESAKKRGVCVADFIKSHPLDFNEPLNESKLFRWVREYKKRGLSALADKRGVGRTGITKLEEWMREHLLEAFRSHGAGGINMLELWNSLHKEAHRRMGYDYYGFLQSKVKPLRSEERRVGKEC